MLLVSPKEKKKRANVLRLHVGRGRRARETRVKGGQLPVTLVVSTPPHLPNST